MKHSEAHNFYLSGDFTKSLDTSTEEWIIEGIASTPGIDREGDIIMSSAVEEALKSTSKCPS